MKTYEFALAGNPNSGKTTLFNALTGSNHQVGNWSGVTVEKKEGRFSFGENMVHLVDMPGTYSLSPFSLEERIAHDYLVQNTPDVIINIVDASSLERNLYLTLQMIEMKVPVVIALNMMDEAEKKGIQVDIDKLAKKLGVPVVPIVALKKEGINELIQVAIDICEKRVILNHAELNYSKSIEKCLKQIELSVEQGVYYHMPPRWIALKLLENDQQVMKHLSEKGILIEDLSESIDYCPSEIADSRYRWIEGTLTQVAKIPNVGYDSRSSFVDHLLLNRFLGVPIFAGVMFAVFQLTFSVGGYFADQLDVFFNHHLATFVLQVLEKIGVETWLQSLIVDGIIGGVGGVLTFVPNIAILFLLISILEDSGYMARAALLMDRMMTVVGLNGRHFIPMIIGFGCNVPAIMSTRTLEDPKERMIAILINPFMSCSARLPVYALFSAVFFPGKETVVTFSLYILGIIVALLAAWLLKQTLFKIEKMPFLMELPAYRFPSFQTLLLHVWDKVSGYLIKAGTVIFSASVLLWFILNFNESGMSNLTDSFGAGIGRVFAPLLMPLGIGTWQAALSLLAGIAAKEIVVANMLIVYGLADTATASQLGSVLSSAFTPLTAYVFMVFVLLYTPCVGVIGVIQRETNSWKWTLFSVFYQLFVAWSVATIIYQIGRALGY